MKPFIVLINKEFVQMIRDYKIIWLPIAFILLGITQPIVTFYLPSIIGSLGSGKGITIDPSMTLQQGGEVLASTLGSQFDQLGIIILAISMMGMIQADKANGMLAFILTRPVSVVSYLSGKIISHYLLAVVSITIGYFASYLYVSYLFTDVPFLHLCIALFYYLVWVLFIVTFIAVVSTIGNSQSIIGLISIVFLIGCRIMVGFSPLTEFVNSASMSKHAMEVLITGSINLKAIAATIGALCWIVLMIYVMHYWIVSKRYHPK
ncbi:membrane protein [Paenibacillus sp. J45TS6]|uniref:hypothetical protein n=1 Tax=Paenibacillus sp. J45TS6 TaxID=2807196 RepID=UPI001B139814|nr:hypothetical protein [Paenibacillus sp. J45TS6]GIP45418.1 membrane protein [Paenibacillus sp. J45TS6]